MIVIRFNIKKKIIFQQLLSLTPLSSPHIEGGFVMLVCLSVGRN